MVFDYQLMFGIDKQIHFIFFAGVAWITGLFILLLVNRSRWRKTLMDAGFALVIIGILEEYRQYFDAWRSTEFLDAVANLSGVAVGLLFPFFLCMVFGRSRGMELRGWVTRSLILVPLFIGLFIINERPFFVLNETLFINHFLTLIGMA
ncbi:VanZ family protein [Halobacillus yeomjeoni]|uniref:VanZ family protein n=1 Tax=Halobacillus yeomjeoni TaxID=311194 RepID=A0A931MVN0_9BACI|nr:VanZ family protein [Halobacillus yeomjeoni]MBH0230790.1 VanZ family protein [Halobacillus yeomjeoni]